MLAGCRAPVFEDEALVAEGISALLIEAERAPVGPTPSVREARPLTKSSPFLNAALLDVDLGDGPVTPVLGALNARGILVLVYTGSAVPEDIPHRHPALVTVAKPVLSARLIGEIQKVIAGSHPYPSPE
jgi:hypothetical protein